jgi:hypothetical protein
MPDREAEGFAVGAAGTSMRDRRSAHSFGRLKHQRLRARLRHRELTAHTPTAQPAKNTAPTRLRFVTTWISWMV